MNVSELDYYQRLKSDYQTHRSLFVAFDYDNTISDYHKQGHDFTAIIDLLRESHKLGFKLILFTANEGLKLEQIKIDLAKRNIPFDYVNENPIMKTSKPYYNILLDDRAGLVESYGYLRKLVDFIKLEPYSEINSFRLIKYHRSHHPNPLPYNESTN